MLKFIVTNRPQTKINQPETIEFKGRKEKRVAGWMMLEPVC